MELKGRAIERENCAEGNSFPIILNLPKTDFLRLSLTPPFPSRRSPLSSCCVQLSHKKKKKLIWKIRRMQKKEK